MGREFNYPLRPGKSQRQSNVEGLASGYQLMAARAAAEAIEHRDAGYLAEAATYQQQAAAFALTARQIMQIEEE